jgi:hypothetical protein
LDRESTGDEKPRNKTRVNLLKTNDSAKWFDFAPNDFNGLRSPVRNAWFRLAKQTLSLSLFLASSTQETNRALRRLCALQGPFAAAFFETGSRRLRTRSVWDAEGTKVAQKSS